MTLYEMTEAAKALYEMLEAEEIDEKAVADTLEGMEVDQKLESYCKLVRQFTTDAEQYKAEADRLTKKKKIAENAVARLKSNMLDYMTAVGKDKESAGLFNIRIAKSKSVAILDESKLPEEFLKPQPPKVDKDGIRKKLLADETVDGAKLVTSVSVQIK